MGPKEKNQKMLVLGATGMLGQAFCRQARLSGWSVRGVARSGSDINLDLSTTADQLKLMEVPPADVIVNAAAVTDLNVCETSKDYTKKINSELPGALAELAQKWGAYFVQVSTDHYYTGDGRQKHDEDHPVKLLNNYASSKFEGEKQALKYKQSLVVRTNIVGFRGLSGKPTFLEWVLTQLKEKKDFKAFDDFITSSIDVGSFSESLLALISGPKPLGILNLASSQVASKKEFIEAIAHEFHFSLEKMSTASVKDLSGAKRGES